MRRARVGNELSVALLISLLAFVFLAAGAAAQQSSPAQQPRGGLFSEEGATDQPLSLGWFLLGLYVLAGVVFAAVCAHQAVHKALSPIPWFFAGFFLNAVGYLILLTRPPGEAARFHAGIPRGLRKVPRTSFSEACPGCGFPNHPGGHYCPGCGARMTPLFESEARRWRKQGTH